MRDEGHIFGEEVGTRINLSSGGQKDDHSGDPEGSGIDGYRKVGSSLFFDVPDWIVADPANYCLAADERFPD